MRLFWRLLGGATVALLTATATPARAGDTSTAEHLFQQGLDAMKRNQFKEACDAFGGSNEADASPGTQINLALCNEKQGKLATAWGWYRTAAGSAEQRGQKERADLARGEAAKIEPKLHKLVITVKGPTENLAVTRNGAPVPHAVLGTDVPIDPGEQVIEVTATGKKPFKQSLRIAAAPGIDRLEVPALEDAPADAVAGTPPRTAGSDSLPPPVVGRDGSTQRNIGFVIGGAGIVAGIVALAVEFLALREDDKSKTEAGLIVTHDPPDSHATSSASHHSAAKSDELAAVVIGAGAVVLIGVGATMVLTAPSGARSADLRKPRVVPILGYGTAGLGVVGGF